MAISYLRGHKAYHDGQWKYCDTGEPVTEDRPCARCGRPPTPEGHDACLGHIEGATAACCGHGVEEGYIKFEGKGSAMDNSTQCANCIKVTEETIGQATDYILTYQERARTLQQHLETIKNLTEAAEVKLSDMCYKAKLRWQEMQREGHENTYAQCLNYETLRMATDTVAEILTACEKALVRENLTTQGREEKSCTT